jgi:hypothetical protein
LKTEGVELRAKASDRFIPDAAAAARSPVQPGQEQQFIAELKLIFRQLEANAETVQAAVRSKMEKRAKMN